MFVYARVCVFALCVVSVPFPTFAQAPAKNKKTTALATGSRAAAAVDPMTEVRRTTAILLVTSLADEARNFHNHTLRARVQARAADALWETDKERARALFRRAWEAAETADTEREKRLEEERRTRTSSFDTGPRLRPEVLRLASKRERSLGEEFLAHLEETKKQEAASAAERPATSTDNPIDRPDPWGASPAVEQRLGVAQQLLDDGDMERAIQFADPALTGVNIPTINFLARLRIKNADAADLRFAALLARAANDPASDSNTVSLLSSYIFSPGIYITFGSGGGASSTSQWGHSDKASTEISPSLRAAFFRAAASVLLRPPPPPQQDRTSSGRAGTYMAITRLLPLFERHAPNQVAALRAQLAALAPDTPQDKRDGKDTALTLGLVPEEETRDRVQNHLERLDAAKTSAERDAIYLRAALAALAEDDPRASEFADKIEDGELRRQVRAYVDFAAVKKALEKKKTDDALRLARVGELTHVQRAWALTEVARLLSKSELGRAAEILEEAIIEARRIDADSPDRARAMAAITTQLLVVDRGRAWEALGEVVKTANAAGEFTGEDGGLTTTLQAKNAGTWMSHSGAESFDLAGIFGALAKDDLNRAVDVAKTFTNEAPRAAVVRAVLDKKKDEGGGMRDE
ncbi:MAG: hypothetical protein M3458_13865 [Acidobacteriota bacterium]|nr:hypothetical protein [Acidobacteriota bacterium]